MKHEHDDCTWVEERLVDHLDAALGTEETARVVDHLATCAGCAAAVDDYAAIRAAYRALPEEEPSATVSAQVMEWARAEGLKPERFGMDTRPGPRPMGLFGRLAAAAVILVALGFWVSSEWGGEGLSFDRQVELAERAFRDGDRRGAIRGYRAALDDVAMDGHPGVPAALHRLAELHLGGGEPDAALSALTTLAGTFPEYPDRAAALVLEGRVHERLGHGSEALEAYLLATELGPDLVTEDLEQRIERLESVELTPDMRTELGAMGYIGD